MLNLITRLFAFGVIALVLATTACSGVPVPLAQSNAPAIVSPEPTSTPLPAATPDAQAQTGKRNQQTQPGQGNVPAANGIEEAVKRLGMTAGIVRTSNDNTIALRTPKGNEKFGVDTNTVIIVPGKTNAKLSDIQTGDRAVVDTRKKKDLADFVLVIPTSYTMDNLVLGAVQASTNGTLTVRARKDSEAVATTSSTIVVKTDQDMPTLASLADIKQGNLVIVLGDKSGTNYNAQAIVILKNDLRGAVAPNANQTPKGTPIPPRQKPGVPVPTPNLGG